MDLALQNRVVVDLSDPGGPETLVAAAGERVDVLVNNVGAAPTRLDGFLAITDAMWQRTFDLDVMAAVRAMRAVLPRMVVAGRGAIVNIGSVNARLPDPLVLDYSAAKAALTSIGKAVSKEFGAAGRPGEHDRARAGRHRSVARSGRRRRTVSRGPGGSAPTRSGRARSPGPRPGCSRHRSRSATSWCCWPRTVTANVTGSEWAVDGGLLPTLWPPGQRQRTVTRSPAAASRSARVGSVSVSPTPATQ